MLQGNSNNLHSPTTYCSSGAIPYVLKRFTCSADLKENIYCGHSHTTGSNMNLTVILLRLPCGARRSASFDTVTSPDGEFDVLGGH